MFVRLTTWEWVKMIWWGLWNPAPALQLPPLKKIEMAPTSCCPTCRRPY